jgi:hypothetical protein
MVIMKNPLRATRRRSTLGGSQKNKVAG